MGSARSGLKFSKVAMGKVQQVLPSTDATITAVSNRVSVLEGYTLHTRLIEVEGQLATLMSQMATMLTHKHDYDDSGVAEVTGLPRQ